MQFDIRNYATNPAAGSTYYAGNSILAMSGTATARLIYVPKACHLKSIELFIECTNAPTTEDVTVNIRKNNTSDYLVGTFNFAGGGATTLHVFNHSLNVPLAAGDYFNLKVTLANPFVTPPQGFYIGGQVEAEG